MKLTARKATSNDLMTVFEWANDKVTRQMSFNQDQITLEDHKRWFNRIINSPGTYLLIIENEESVPIGQIRVDNDGEISHSIAKEFRGQKLGTPSLEAAMNYIRTKTDVKEIFAQIKSENTPTLRIYEKYGYNFVSEGLVHGSMIRKYTYQVPR